MHVLDHSPYLVSCLDWPAGEESYAWEAQVLVHGKHPHSQQVRLTQVVNKAANVAEKPCIDAVHVTHLRGSKTEKTQRLKDTHYFLIRAFI